MRPYAPTQQKAAPKCAECGCEISPADVGGSSRGLHRKEVWCKIMRRCAKTLKNQIEQAEEIAEAKAEEEAKTTSTEIIDGEIVEGIKMSRQRQKYQKKHGKTRRGRGNYPRAQA